MFGGTKGNASQISQKIVFTNHAINLIWNLPLFWINVSLFSGLDFTKDGKYMALAERRNCKDCISIFACSSWQLVKVHIHEWQNY